MRMIKKLSALAMVMSVSSMSSNAIANQDDTFLAESTVTHTEILSKEQELVTNYYKHLLKRQPDPQGLQYWVDEINSRGCNAETLKDIVWSFTALPSGGIYLGFMDQINQYQGLNRSIELVTRLYHGALHRFPDRGGYVHWVEGLESGQFTDEEVINGFIHSAEFKERSKNEWCR